ncbi:MAG: ABC transporter permease [Rhodospirillales bacterium]
MTDNSAALARRDIVEGLKNWRLWHRLGWIEMRRRYRRTVIGPFWTSLSMAIFAVAVGLIFSTLWRMRVGDYLPFLTSGLATWILISTVMTEGCNVFVSAEGLLKQTPLPYSVFVYLNIWRNLIVFAHNLGVYVIIALIFSVPVNANTLLVVPGIMFFAVNGVWVTLLLALVSSRYRDVQPMVSSLLQIAMLITPIFWPPEQIGDIRPFVVEPNIIYHFVDIIRAPLLGKAPLALSWIIVAVTTVVGWTVAFMVYSRYRKRIVFWI